MEIWEKWLDYAGLELEVSSPFLDIAVFLL